MGWLWGGGGVGGHWVTVSDQNDSKALLFTGVVGPDGWTHTGSFPLTDAQNFTVQSWLKQTGFYCHGYRWLTESYLT